MKIKKGLRSKFGMNIIITNNKVTKALLHSQ